MEAKTRVENIRESALQTQTTLFTMHMYDIPTYYIITLLLRMTNTCYYIADLNIMLTCL